MKRNTPIKSQSKAVLLILCMMLLSLSISYAQKKTEFIKGGKVSIESKILGEKRIMTVYLPESYNSGSQKYPVLYLLDGRAHFYHTTSAVNFLSNRGITPQIIVVAVYNVDRNRDFSPSHVERIPTSGGAEKFLNFISDELTEYIDNNYRTSNFSVLMGHSFGGTFATYSLLTKPELFDAYIAVSPFLHYDDNYLVKEAGKTQHSDFKGQKYFYMTIGDEPNYYSALGDFSSIINEKYSEIIDLDYVKMESEDHATTPYLSVFNGLRFIFSDWQIPASELEQGLSAVDEYYKNLSAKYEMEVTSSENLLNRLGYTYLQNEDIENAIMVFKENVKRYPKSSNVYDSLGEAYEKNDQLDLALKNYKIAYDLGMKENHVNTGVYLKNLKRVQQK